MNYFLLLVIAQCLFLRSIEQINNNIMKEQVLKLLNGYNNQPVIGIYTVPSTYPEKYPTNQYLTIDASYFAGAQVVPIYHTSTQEELLSKFNQVNGILFTGGDVDFVNSQNQWTQFVLNAQFLIRLAITATDNEDYFPIWGTCLGFQLITSVISGDKTLLEIVNNTNASENITFINRNQSIIFASMPPDLVSYSQTQAPYFFNHHWGIPLEKWYVVPQLLSFFNITAIGYAPTTNITFVAGIEGQKYPIFGSQFHPETEQFMWTNGINIDHSYEAIQISQYIANQFVDKARNNYHQFVSTEEFQKWSIYNWKWIEYPTESDMASFFFESGNTTSQSF